jgi:hypothetical protein
VTWLRRRVGRRGAALLIFAFIDFVIGWSLLDPATQSQARALPSYRAHVAIVALEVWGWWWIVVGLACVGHAFVKRDGVGYGAAIGIKVVWAGGFLASWLVHDAPRAWLGAATWGVFACLVYLIARWPEPVTITPVDEERRVRP